MHVAVAAWTFAPALFLGRVPYLRDISTYFYPNLVFLERSLASGVFPLWHPGAEAGSPFLLVYPVDVALAALLGARATLAAGPALHTLLGSLGAAALARRLGVTPLAAAVAGLVFALAGATLSFANLVPLHQAAAWAPLVLLAALRCAAAPGPRAAAALAAALALQVSTLAGEIVLQTLAAAVVLLWGRAGRRSAPALAGAAAVAALLSAPAWMGAASMLRETRRGGGFSAAESLAASLAPVELAGIALPRFFGDMHTFSAAGFWGQDVFSGGFPYLLSLYLGVPALAIAALAGRDRAWILVGAGLALALGAHGPLGLPLAALAVFRAPVKFAFLATLGVALLVGRGLDRAGTGRARFVALVPAAALTLLAIALAAAPDRAAAALGALPRLAAPEAQAVIRAAWPAAFLASGLLALGAAAAAAHGGRTTPLAGLLVVLDLLLVNGDVNRFAPRGFYDLRPEVRALLAPAREAAPARVFGYGIGNTPGLRFAPEVLRDNSDVWLYFFDRQVLWGRTPVLDGLEGAFDEDRTAWSPPGATLAAGESVPAAFPGVAERLRGANVRWVLSFAPLPAPLASERGTAVVPGVLAPLRLYEVTEALPRAFFARDPSRLVPEAAEVTAAADGPHLLRVRAVSPAGHVVVVSGWDAGWQATRGDGAAVRVGRAGARYLALETPGGEHVFTLRYRPRWWPPALALAALGAVATALALSRRPRAPGAAARPGGQG